MAMPSKKHMTHGSTRICSFSVKNGASCMPDARNKTVQLLLGAGRQVVSPYHSFADAASGGKRPLSSEIRRRCWFRCAIDASAPQQRL